MCFKTRKALIFLLSSSSVPQSGKLNYFRFKNFLFPFLFVNRFRVKSENLALSFPYLKIGSRCFKDPAKASIPCFLLFLAYPLASYMASVPIPPCISDIFCDNGNNISTLLKCLGTPCPKILYFASSFGVVMKWANL